MHKRFLILGSLFGAIAVVLGAFGAHSLKQVLPVEALSVFETGVRYQFYHSFALIVSGILYAVFPGKWLRYAGACFIGGIVLFSGSLYGLSLLKAVGNVGLTGIGIITPFGGLLFIAGWICLMLAVSRKQ